MKNLLEGKIIITVTILTSIVPTTLNLLKNFIFNKKFKEEFRKAFNLKLTTTLPQSTENVWQEIQNLLKSVNSFTGSVKRKNSSARKISEQRSQRRESMMLKNASRVAEL